jgi:DNA-binding transcriptional LysR family regulator
MTYRELPPLNALRAFEAAARHQSVSRAADELHVTHGAVSRQLRLLEEALGRTLFTRQGRQLALTEAGEQLRRRRCGVRPVA